MTTASILVVEDNPKNLKLIRDVLSFKGYMILEAGSGEEGIELAISEQPGLILMDIQLPGIDGREAVRILKSDAHTRDIPVVALTAFAMKGDKERLLSEGFDGYVAKPVDIGTLPDTVESYLDTQS